MCVCVCVQHVAAKEGKPEHHHRFDETAQSPHLLFSATLPYRSSSSLFLFAAVQKLVILRGCDRYGDEYF